MYLSFIKPALLIAGGFFLLVLQGCSLTPLQSDLILDTKPVEFLQPQEIISVPFNPQREYQCGPAALATVLQWLGVNVSADELVKDVYIPGRKGSLQIEIMATARRYNLIPYVIDRNIESLLREVKAGNPVLVLQNLGLGWHPLWHYAVVVGYDINKDQVILRSGEIKRYTNSFSLFERTWQRSQYWGLVILPNNKLPATGNAFSYLKSVVPFEEIYKQDVAYTAYQTALRKWPEDKHLLMAYGNASYSRENYIDAAASYSAVIKNEPTYAPALNNLAQVLFDLHRYAEARTYAEKAVLNADKYKVEYEKTLDAILQRISAKK
jgi:tetratricopeptide (TPR) repeat protein